MTTNRILIVDDEEDLEALMCQRFRRSIRKGEYEFLFARNGREALDVLEKNSNIHLVISDINMPVMDGLSLLNQLSSTNPEICVVIISAYGDMTNIRTAMNRGAFDFISKPIDFNDLKITIEKTLKHIDIMQQALASRDHLVSIKKELAIAKNVQMSALPVSFPQSEYYELSAKMIPAREVGGDFFDYFALDENRIGIVVADVSGKGVPAALFTMVTRAVLKSVALNHQSPAQCLSEVNNLLSQDNHACMFVTLYYGVLDLRDGRLNYSNGGHNPPRLVRGADAGVEVFPLTTNLALGIIPGYEFHDDEIQLEVGDALFLYTDGVTEARNTSNEEFGNDRLDNQLSKSNQSQVENLVDVVVKAVEQFAGEMEQFDDITCLAVRWNAIKPPDSAPCKVQ
jgi:sigma-B regulation protein RsbU (phosphoserine phosphatase)